MLVFNCTKAAADFFTTIKKGEKLSCIEAAPNKTIAESINKKHLKDAEPQWQWLIHAIKIKRKNVLIVMDCNTRFSMTFTGLKKGDEIAFLNMFEHHISLHVNQLMQAVVEDIDELEQSMQCYGDAHFSCAFHQRGDRSVQATINDIAWHFESQAYNSGYVAEDFALIKFDAFVNQMLRKNKGNKDYFQPHHEFLSTWLTDYSDFSQNEIKQKMKAFKDDEKAFHRGIEDIDFIEMADADELSSDELAKNSSNKQSNVISLDLFS